MGDYDDKVVIVTGGAMGIGAAIAEAFAREGAAVTVADIDQAVGQRLVERFASYGHKARFVRADLAGADDCRSVVSETVSTFGGVDILCNNVGIQPPDSYRRVEDTTEEMWDRIIDVNLKSYFLMSKFAIPEIRKRGGGVIVNTASVQGLQSMPGVPAYAASKGGILSLTRQMSLDMRAQPRDPLDLVGRQVGETGRHKSNGPDTHFGEHTGAPWDARLSQARRRR